MFDFRSVLIILRVDAGDWTLSAFVTGQSATTECRPFPVANGVRRNKRGLQCPYCNIWAEYCCFLPVRLKSNVVLKNKNSWLCVSNAETAHSKMVKNTAVKMVIYTVGLVMFLSKLSYCMPDQHFYGGSISCTAERLTSGQTFVRNKQYITLFLQIRHT